MRRDQSSATPMVRSYYRMHIPSGKVSKDKTEDVITEFEILRHIADWNRQGGKLWKYWR